MGKILLVSCFLNSQLKLRNMTIEYFNKCKNADNIPKYASGICACVSITVFSESSFHSNHLYVNLLPTILSPLKPTINSFRHSLMHPECGNTYTDGDE